MGDEVMAIFNKAGDQPDHALLARAAVSLQEGAADVARQRPDWPRFRVGVNSGEVLAGVAGPRGHRKHGVVGDTVNLASRLQAASPVGQVVVGAETLRRLPPGAVVERLPELLVKERPSRWRRTSWCGSTRGLRNSLRLSQARLSGGRNPRSQQRMDATASRGVIAMET